MLTLPALALAIACNQSSTTSHESASGAPAPEASASAASLKPKEPLGQFRPPHPPPSWYASFPSKPVPGKAGDRVWALHQNGAEGASLELVEIVSIEKDTATVARLAQVPSTGKLERSRWGELYALVPGAIMFPAHKVADLDLQPGEWVLSYRINSRFPFLSRVKGTRDGVATVETPHARTLSEVNIQYAERLPTEITPLAPIAIKEAEGWRRAVVAVVDGETVYAVDGTNRLHTVKRSDCKLLVPQLKDRKVGEKVMVFPMVGVAHQDTITHTAVAKWVFDTRRIPDVPFDRIYDLDGFQ